ncbi:MAG: iron-sulfur cluster assembly scaffold protein [Deltaproteobacteria bacterium]|nr:iron-sulfur cluster assembly scaffold protein [Deltaproteobacteria bacterium]
MTDWDEFISTVQKQEIEKAREIYSETVVQHAIFPRDPGSMENPDGYARVTGPCGDTMEIFIRVLNGKISKANFLTDGCTTSIAAASMAVEMATDKKVEDARCISKEDILEALDGLPEESRHCALLASNTLRAAVADYLKMAKEPWKKFYQPASHR